MVNDANSAPKFVMLEDKEEEEEREFSYFWERRRGNEAASVVVLENPLGPGLVWEQRLEDVEAERGRKVVTSPGFSFSAAGLLFPYHLGVAKFLIEKGYIKVGVLEYLCIM